MKTNEFKNMIRNIISEELNELLPKILNEYFRKDGTTVPKNSLKNVINETKASNSKQTVSEQQVKRPFKKYTNNDALNAILNETVPKPEMMSDSYSPSVTMIEEGSNRNASPIPSNVAPEIKSALTRDYSSLMKKVNDKVKVSRGG